jgi:hypothetical protein
MKTRLFLILAAVAVLASTSGCMAMYMAQLQKKLPKIDAEELEISGHTIYGVSGELRETGVKWVNGVKTVETLHGRVDSPIGSFVVNGKKGKIRQ